ncbi:unnamed protein product [Moneuplotes crassus]|uniref:Uncharacterized protein n=1 Tax=Euplotes crassus TaxID=5936 RepID=A0AAD1YAG1_EUPCR|nr:unnamed protein product [Moneuplotes crassus]
MSQKRNEKRISDKNIQNPFGLAESIRNPSFEKSISSVKGCQFKYSRNKKKRPIGIKMSTRYSQIEKGKMSPMHNFEDLFVSKNIQGHHSISVHEQESYLFPNINQESGQKSPSNLNGFKQRFSVQNKKIDPIKIDNSFRSKKSFCKIDSGEENSSKSPMLSTIKPPLHPLVLKTKKEVLEEGEANSRAKDASERIERAENSHSKSKLAIPTSENDIMSILVDKVVEDNVCNENEEQKSSQNQEFDYFNDKLLKFKLMKVKNIFAPTYQMDKKEGEKIRYKIKMDAQNEMDTIINKTINENKKLNKKSNVRVVYKKPTEGSSDSTSEGSNSFQARHAKAKNHLKNRVIRMKQKKNKKSLMSKLNIIRNNIYQQRMHSKDGMKTHNPNNYAFRSLQDLRKSKEKGLYDRKKDINIKMLSTLEMDAELTKRSVLNINHSGDFFEEHD